MNEPEDEIWKVQAEMHSLLGRSLLRDSCSFHRPVVTPYNFAKSESSITRCPRTTWISVVVQCLTRIVAVAHAKRTPEPVTFLYRWNFLNLRRS